MTESEQVLRIEQILSGRQKMVVRDEVFYLVAATPWQRCRAEEIYQEVYQDSCVWGCYTEPEMLGFLARNNLWTSSHEQELTTFQKDMEVAKKRAFQAVFRQGDRQTFKAVIAEIKRQIGRLLGLKHAFDHLMSAGLAAMARLRCLTALRLRNQWGKRVWKGECWQEDTFLLDAVVQQTLERRLEESTSRLLARSAYWQGYWANRKDAASLFGKVAIQLTEEQRQLVSYSEMYDSISQHPDCPVDEVIQDDDLLDGWILLQKEKRLAERRKQEMEQSVGNDKISQCQEVFLMGRTPEDIRRIEELNDTEARIRKMQRAAYLNKHGEVKEQDMPDTRVRLQQEFAKAESAFIKGKR